MYFTHNYLNTKYTSFAFGCLFSSLVELQLQWNNVYDRYTDSCLLVVLGVRGHWGQGGGPEEVTCILAWIYSVEDGGREEGFEFDPSRSTNTRLLILAKLENLYIVFKKQFN
jgi:hypothetical protein